MAFCNSCGAALDPSTRFCNKCGAAVLASTPVSAARPAVSATPAPMAPAQAPRQGSSALKIVLIIVAMVFVIGFLALGTIGFIGWRVAKRVHQAQIHQDANGNVRVDTPFGSAETNKDPTVAARELNIEIYPGAQLEAEGSSSATIFGMHTVTARYRSSDSLEQVSNFYKSKYPNAMMSTCDTNACNIVSTDQKGTTTTINIQGVPSGTEIKLTQLSKRS
jgi:zinc-ribbon domain